MIRSIKVLLWLEAAIVTGVLLGGIVWRLWRGGAS
jgi:hypothetical protein